MIDLTNSPLYPKLPEDVMKTLLTPPTTARETPLRVVLDTDMDNEIDDFFAMVRLILAVRESNISLEAIYAAPYSFRARLLDMLQAQDLQQLCPTKLSAPEQALVDKYASQIAAIEAIGLNPREFLTSPDGCPGKYDHVSIGPGVGMERSFHQTGKLAQLMEYKGRVYRGADHYLENGCPVRSDAVLHLIELARKASTHDPIYVLGIACATNMASALLLAPDIRDKVVFIWTAGYPSNSNLQNTSFNLDQDIPAAQVLFTSACALVYLPGFYIGQQLTLSQPDMLAWFANSGDVGSVLLERYENNPLFPWYGIERDNLTGRIWNIWDLINVAWFVTPSAVPTQLVKAPKLSDNMYWIPNPDGALMLEGTYTSVNAIFPPFVKKLKAYSSQS